MNTQQQEQNAGDETGYMPRRRKGRKGKVFLLLACLVLAGGAYYWSGNGDQLNQTEPLIATVEYGDIENSIAATGSVRPKETVEVGAQVSGQLEVLHVEAGDTVEEGDLLAEIDASQFQSRVDSSRASLEGLQAQLESRRSSLRLSEANAERQRRLMEEDATSQQEYDSAMNQLESSRASLTQLERQIEQSEASLAIDERELEYTDVEAPISGTVTSIAMEEGRTLNASQTAPTILSIADLSIMEVATEISEADISRLQPGMEVYFTTLGNRGREWHSQLLQILPQPTTENNVVLYTGMFEVENKDRVLLPEMTAQVYFVTSAARDVLTVPVGALTYEDAAGPTSAGSGFNRSGSSGGSGPPQGPEPPGDFPSSVSSVQGGSGSSGRGDRSENRQATVQVVNEDGTYTHREVTIGLSDRVSAEVISGLEAGEQVVAGIADPEQDQDGNLRRAMRGF